MRRCWAGNSSYAVLSVQQGRSARVYIISMNDLIFFGNYNFKVGKHLLNSHLVALCQYRGYTFIKDSI